MSTTKISLAVLRAASAAATAFLVASCDNGITTTKNGASASSLSGIASPFVGLVAQTQLHERSLFSRLSFFNDAVAVPCGAITAELYALDSGGNLSANAITSVPLTKNDAAYEFTNLSSYGVDITANTNIKYVVRVNGCNQDYKRPITNNGEQEVNASSTLLAQFADTAQSAALASAKKSDIEAFLKKLSGSTVENVYTTIVGSAALTAEFNAIFGVAPTVLRNAAPQIINITAPNTGDEQTNLAYQVTASHWDPAYNVVYLWKLDGANVSTSNNYTYTPGKNAQGSHTVTLWVGKDDGAGGVDITKPFQTKTYSVAVNNSMPPTAPAVALNSGTPSPRNTQTVTLDLNTGAAMANCASFTKLAITENTAVAPVDPADFTITCTTGPTQSVNYTVSAGDGTKALRVWAMDSSNTVSSAATSVNVLLDTVSPTLSAFSVNGGVTAASSNTVPIAFTTSDANPSSGVNGYMLSQNAAFTGASWQAIEPMSYSFPFSTGTYTLYAKIKDAAGNESSALSGTITITIGAPPIVNFVVPSSSIGYTATGQLVHLSWKTTLQSANPLSATGTNVYYSTDNGLTKTAWPSGTGLSGTVNGGCTLDADATGCVDLLLPAALVNQKFSIIVSVADSVGASGMAKSLTMNGPSGLNRYAGRDSTILGGYALSTSLNYTGGIGRDPVTGDIYLGSSCQILIISAATGTIDKWAGHPTACATAGDGSALANARFQIWAPTIHMTYMAPTIHIDQQRNVYWMTLAGIWKYTRLTGNAEIIVSLPAVGAGSLASGTHRRNIATMPSIMRFGYNNRLYLGVLVQCTNHAWERMCHAVYRLEDNDTLTHVAGVNVALTGAAPTNGADPKTVWFNSFAVKPGATSDTDDKIYFMGGHGRSAPGGLWEIQTNNTVNLLASPTATVMGPYLTSMGKIPIILPNNSGAYRTTLWLFDPAAPAAAMTAVTGIDGSEQSMTEATDSGNGGFYFTSGMNRLVYYYDSTQGKLVFAGVLPDVGDGGPATQAELRTPDHLTVDSTGNLFISDTQNNRIRKVDSSGVISATWVTTTSSGCGYQYNWLSKGAGGNVYTNNVCQGYGWNHGIFNMAGSCVLACGGSGNVPLNYWATTLTSATPSTLHIADGTNLSVDNTVAVDGTNTFVITAERNPSWQMRLWVKKIDSANNLTTLSGNAAHVHESNAALSYAVPEGSDFATTRMGNFEAGHRPWVTDNVLFFMGVANAYAPIWYMYSASLAGGNWVKQSPTVITGGAITVAAHAAVPTNIYFINNKVLYRKPYVAGGDTTTGNQVAIADFNNVLSNPVVHTYDPSVPNSMYIVDGNIVYRFTDPVNVP